MKIIEVTIVGTSPLLQNRFTEAAEKASGSSTRRVVTTQQLPRDRAAERTYKTTDGKYYHPGTAIARALRESGANHKMRGSRKSIKFIVPSAVLVMDDAITLNEANGKKPLKDFEVDARPVVIPATKGRIMCHRPRWDAWSASFTLRVNDELLGVDMVQKLLTDAGEQLGIGDFRPEKGGPFGTFRVTKFEEKKD